MTDKEVNMGVRRIIGFVIAVILYMSCSASLPRERLKRLALQHTTLLNSKTGSNIFKQIRKKLILKEPKNLKMIRSLDADIIALEEVLHDTADIGQAQIIADAMRWHYLLLFNGKRESLRNLAAPYRPDQ